MFTTPCFVRVEDAEKRKELIEWLEEIGYNIICDFGNPNIVQVFNSITTVRIHSTIESVKDNYDCVYNIDLFKALAAMNDENNREQWYICYDALTECRYMVGQMYLSTDKRESTTLGIGAYVHKATKEEIIEYFKNK